MSCVKPAWFIHFHCTWSSCSFFCCFWFCFVFFFLLFPGHPRMLIKIMSFAENGFYILVPRPHAAFARYRRALASRMQSFHLKEMWFCGKLGARELTQRLRKRKHYLKREFTLFKTFNASIPFCSVCQMKAIYLFEGLYIKVQKKKSFAFGKFPRFKVVTLYIDSIEFRSLSKLFFLN